MRFCAHLADRLHHSFVKVYLSAVRSLHIDYGYPDPLSTCLHLQRLLNAVKCNLMELTTRSTSLTSAVSGLACTRTCQDSSCSCATEHGTVWMAFFFCQRFLVLAFLQSVGTPCLTCAASSLACMRRCQDSSCSCTTEHGIVWMAFFVSVSSISVSPERGDSLFDQRGQWFVIYAHVPGFLMLLRHQGANLPQRKPVTADLMGVLHQSLELSNPDNVLLWAPLLWSFPAWLFFISLGRGSAPLCPVLALTNYLHPRGPGVGPLFIFEDGRPCQGPAYLRFCTPPYRQLAFWGSSQATA